MSSTRGGCNIKEGSTPLFCAFDLRVVDGGKGRILGGGEGKSPITQPSAGDAQDLEDGLKKKIKRKRGTETLHPALENKGGKAVGKSLGLWYVNPTYPVKRKVGGGEMGFATKLTNREAGDKVWAVGREPGNKRGGGNATGNPYH